MDAVSNMSQLTDFSVNIGSLDLKNFTSTPQNTLMTLSLAHLNIDSSDLLKLLRTFQSLRCIEMDYIHVIEQHIYVLCDACPQLERVVLSKLFHFTSF